MSKTTGMEGERAPSSVERRWTPSESSAESSTGAEPAVPGPVRSESGIGSGDGDGDGRVKDERVDDGLGLDLGLGDSQHPYHDHHDTSSHLDNDLSNLRSLLDRSEPAFDRLDFGKGLGESGDWEMGQKLSTRVAGSGDRLTSAGGNERSDEASDSRGRAGQTRSRTVADGNGGGGSESGGQGVTRLLNIRVAQPRPPNNLMLNKNEGDNNVTVLMKAAVPGISDRDLKKLRRVSGPIPWQAYSIAFVELCERFSYYGTTAVCK